MYFSLLWEQAVVMMLVGIRFDVIEVTLGTRGTPDIVWHKGAFLAS